MLELTRDQINSHWQNTGLESRASLATALTLESDFVVLWVDAHNGLHMHAHSYTGLNHGSPSGRSVYQECKLLMDF